MIAAQENVDQTFEITPSTTTGGSTYNAPALQISGSTSNATFAGNTSANIVIARDNMYVGAGQLYIGAENGSTNDTFRQAVVSGQFRVESRESGTWTQRFMINTVGLVKITSDDQAVADFDSTNSDGPYNVYKTSGTIRGYIGNAQGIMNGGATNFGIRAENDLAFSTSGGSERMRITSGGIVQINTNTAKTNTSTVEFGSFGQSNEATNYSTLQMYTKGGASQADRSVVFQTIEAGVANAGNIVLQPSGGNVEIGGNTSAGRLTVDNASGNTLALRKGTGTPSIAFGGTNANEAVGLLEGITGGGFSFYVGSGTLASSTWSNSFIINADKDVYNYQSANKANTFYGYAAGDYSSNTSGNTFMGYNVGNNLTTGSNNTGMGRDVFIGTLTGDANTAVGTGAGRLLGSGSRNSLFGDGAGDKLANASDNVAIGYEALFTNVGSGQNVAIGVNAARTFTGSRLVAIGIDAAKTLASDVDNVFIGQQCGEKRTGGVDNTFVGSYANYNGASTGCCNTGFGKSTGYELTSGVQNTFLGRQAGYSVTTADNNTMVGHNAGIYATGGQNTLIGSGAGDAITTGNHNNIFGYNCEASSVGGTDQIVIGTNGQVGKGNSTGFISPGTGGVYQGNNSTTWSTTSDKRIKKNIVDNNKGLEIIDKIQVRNFEYRTEEEIIDFENPKSAVVNQEGIQLGVIAQEIEKVLPEVVTEESTGVKTVNVDNLTWYLINAVKELKAEIEILKNK